MSSLFVVRMLDSNLVVVISVCVCCNCISCAQVVIVLSSSSLFVIVKLYLSICSSGWGSRFVLGVLATSSSADPDPSCVIELIMIIISDCSRVVVVATRGVSFVCALPFCSC